jgi:Resolvase, N terminal domain
VSTSSGLAAQKISPSHLGRDAYVYIRQSTQTQVMMNTESLARQYELAERAGHMGWHTAQIVTIDADLGQSGARSDGRLGFKELVADVGLGKVGIVLGIEVSRLARNNADWYQLLDLCALTDTLIADTDGIYHPADFNDRLVLGLKGTMSEALCRYPHKSSLGYSLNRSRIGSCSWSSPVLHGRFAAGRSRLGG